MEAVNAKTGMTQAEMKRFIRNHFEEFVNRKNLDIADVNFAPDFVDHGTDVPPGTLPGRPGQNSMSAAPTNGFPTFTWTSKT